MGDYRGRGFAGRQGLLAQVLVAAAIAVAGSGATPLQAAVANGAVAQDEQRELAHAAELIDSWGGQSDLLDAARAELDAVLARNPGSAEAHVLYARYQINKAMINSRNYDEAGLAGAGKSLDRAIELSPSLAEAFVLRGRLYRLLKRPGDARTALTHARMLGSDSPWLALNEADLLLDDGKYAEALAGCRAVAKHHASKAYVLDSAEACMREAHWGLGQFSEVDALYRSQIKRQPQHAWARGNYASFLLCTQENPQAATESAVSALELMDYGVARGVLSAALYRDWADRVRAGRLDLAEQAWKKAVGYAPGDPAQIMRNACGMKATFPVLYALRDSGRALLIAPMAAVLLAADAEDEGIPGVFGVEVMATGRSPQGEMYLNSEADYRDQRNLTVRFTPKAAAAYRAQHGQDPDTALKGKRITIVGAARRQRIDFLNFGVPTGKFYYQTHVVVSDPAQVAIQDVRPVAPPLPLPAATDV